MKGNVNSLYRYILYQPNIPYNKGQAQGTYLKEGFFSRPLKRHRLRRISENEIR